MPTPSLEDRLAAIEERLAELEKHSHPPVNLVSPVHRAMANILMEAAEIAALNARE